MTTNPSLGNGALSSLDVLKVLEEKGVQELMVCLEQRASSEVQHLFARCLGRGIRVSLVPQSYELYCSRARLVELEGVPLVTLEGLRHSRVAAAVKRMTDLILVVPLVTAGVPDPGDFCAGPEIARTGSAAARVAWGATRRTIQDVSP